MDSLEGRVAVITGAGSGIGRGTALVLARRGASIVLADLNAERVAEAAEEVRTSTGAKAIGVVTDVSDQASVDNLADRAFAEFGNVHVLCNNAGTATVGYSWEAPLSDWAFTLGVNLMGPVHGIRSFVPRMLEKGEPGHIVNTSSMAGLRAVVLNAAYTASKHAVVGLSRTLEADFATIGAPIGVSVVCPGGVSTAIIDDQIARYASAGPLGEAEQGVLDGLKAVVDEGMSPERAGEMIAAAIEGDRFWVFPNAESLFGPVEDEWARIQECRKAV